MKREKKKRKKRLRYSWFGTFSLTCDNSSSAIVWVHLTIASVKFARPGCGTQ